MYLKALELRGFKSFPDKTRLEFNQGVTCVVGPNGSGKSNISDAVKWVLGEMSPKSLRGSKMEDVVFAGTARRSQTGFCEVSIIIDNKNGQIPTDTEEVKVTRKYYRSGDSEYRINDKPSRLKDIHELFLNTGIGREGYSVIGQGKIAEVLSQKSEERRRIFEEAAGISKYRYRKNDAEKKLAETDTNLIRLNDIAGEISLRLPPLEKDAENAKKFLVLNDRKKELEVAIWLDKIIKASEKSKELEEKLTLSRDNYNTKENEVNLLDSAIEGIFNKKQFVSQTTQNIRDEISNLEQESNRLLNLCNISTNDISHLEERKTQINAEVSLLSGTELESLKVKLCDSENKIKEFEDKLSGANTSLSACQKALDKAILNVEECEKALFLKQDEIRITNDELVNLKIEEAASQTSEKSENERKDFLNAEILKADAELESAYKSLENAQKRKTDFNLQKIDITNDLSEEQKNLEELNTQRNDLLTQKNQFEALLAADMHKKEVLDRMDKMLDGYPGSVKAVMNESSLSGICGPVSRILNVTGEYVTAIETALGAAVSNIVVENEHSAKEGIRFLKRTNGGRATFLPLTSVNSKELNEQGLTKCEGFIGIASNLVTYDKKYEVIAENLLGRCVVTDNIDNASEIAKKYSYKFKIVTLDGQVINSGGSYTGGSSAARTGVMSRNADIANLDKAIVDTTNKISQIKKSISENTEERQNCEEFIESLKNDLASADSGLYRSENDIKMQNEHIESCTARLKNLHAQLDEFDDEKIKEKLSVITAEIASKQARLEVLTNEEKELSQKLDDADNYQKECEDNLSNTKLELLSCEKDLANENSTLTSIRAQIADNARRTFSLNEELSEIEKQLSGISVDIENMRLKAQETTVFLESKKAELTKQIELSESLELDINKKREEQKLLQKDKEVFFEETTRLEAQVEKFKNEYDDLTSKLWEEYTLTFSDAAAMNLPSPKSEDISELSSIKAKIRALGHINVNAVEEYKETKERYDFMSKQISDLENSKKSLENVIKRLEADMKTMFTKAVDEINISFKQVFSELFGGGNADIVITDPENVLESGIDINIQPPGKMVKSISLLSGGEQAFTAIALYFAILKVNPAPFYIFDEIEAALDDVNVNRFAAYVKKHSDTQFIIITHRRGTMEIADTMYGVTMQEKGVSSFLKVSIDDVEKKTGIKL